MDNSRVVDALNVGNRVITFFFVTCNMCGQPKCSSCNVAFPHKNALRLQAKSRTLQSNKDSNCNAEEDRNAFYNFSVDSSENDLSYFDFFHKRGYFDISSLNGPPKPSLNAFYCKKYSEKCR